jgi:hypothetical protein
MPPLTQPPAAAPESADAERALAEEFCSTSATAFRSRAGRPHCPGDRARRGRRGGVGGTRRRLRPGLHRWAVGRRDEARSLPRATWGLRIRAGGSHDDGHVHTRAPAIGRHHGWPMRPRRPRRPRAQMAPALRWTALGTAVRGARRALRLWPRNRHRRCRGAKVSRSRYPGQYRSL